MTNVKGFTRKTKHQIQYPNPPSVSLPLPHSDVVPIPNRPTFTPQTESSASTTSISNTKENDPDFLDDSAPKLLTQEDLDDLVRDLYLPKESAQLLGSRLREKNLLAPDTTYSWYRNREREFTTFFTMENSLVYCKDVNGLIAQMGHVYDAKEWRLFIDSSKRSLKAVLLHNGNDLASLPIAHSVNMKESYEDMKTLLSAIKYTEHKWLVCGDLKMIAILLGLQGGYTKHPCFLCLWDSRADDLHFKQKRWPDRTETIPGKDNVIHLPLVNASNILLPPLHIKLGLMKQFVKALNTTGRAFQYLVEKFPQVSDAKLKGGIFIGPQIRDLMNDATFTEVMTRVEKQLGKTFRQL
jgi:hypothetical protein